jgi:hypothetical protein
MPGVINTFNQFGERSLRFNFDFIFTLQKARNKSLGFEEDHIQPLLLEEPQAQRSLHSEESLTQHPNHHQSRPRHHR